VWNQPFVFRFNDLTKQQLQDLSIKFTVYDRRFVFLKDAMIGCYEMDLTSVYFAYHHEMYRVWLTLTDPTDQREGIMGYVNIAIQVLGPFDEPTVHDINTESQPVPN